MASLDDDGRGTRCEFCGVEEDGLKVHVLKEGWKEGYILFRAVQLENFEELQRSYFSQCFCDAFTSLTDEKRKTRFCTHPRESKTLREAER